MLIRLLHVCAVLRRLKSKGLLADIQAEWDDWQHDLLLDTIQLQLTNPGSMAAAAAGRQRRGRAEMEAGGCANGTACASAGGAGQEPRRVSHSELALHLSQATVHNISLWRLSVAHVLARL